jgi:hypothetical protein
MQTPDSKKITPLVLKALYKTSNRSRAVHQDYLTIGVM